MSSIETLPKPSETDTDISLQSLEESFEEIAATEKPELPKPGLGDFDLERSRAGFTEFARLTGHLALGPRIHIRRR